MRSLNTLNTGTTVNRISHNYIDWLSSPQPVIVGHIVVPGACSLAACQCHVCVSFNATTPGLCDSRPCPDAGSHRSSECRVASASSLSRHEPPRRDGARSLHAPLIAPLFGAGGTSAKAFTIDVTDYVNNVLNGNTDSRTHAAFAVVRLFRRNAEGSGSLGYSADSLGSNNVVRTCLLATVLGELPRPQPRPAMPR